MMKGVTDSTEAHVVNRRDTSGELMAEEMQTMKRTLSYEKAQVLDFVAFRQTRTATRDNV